MNLEYSVIFARQLCVPYEAKVKVYIFDQQNRFKIEKFLRDKVSEIMSYIKFSVLDKR